MFLTVRVTRTVLKVWKLPTLFKYFTKCIKYFTEKNEVLAFSIVLHLLHEVLVFSMVLEWIYKVSFKWFFQSCLFNSQFFGDLFFSVIGLVINLILVFGVFYAMSCSLVIWLVAYSINISGCFVLFGTVVSILMRRQDEEEDVQTGTMMITLVPLFLAVLYIICWCFVFKLWRKVRDRDNQVFVCIE